MVSDLVAQLTLLKLFNIDFIGNIPHARFILQEIGQTSSWSHETSHLQFQVNGDLPTSEQLVSAQCRKFVTKESTLSRHPSTAVTSSGNIELQRSLHSPPISISDRTGNRSPTGNAAMTASLLSVVVVAVASFSSLSTATMPGCQQNQRQQKQAEEENRVDIVLRLPPEYQPG